MRVSEKFVLNFLGQPHQKEGNREVRQQLDYYNLESNKTHIC